MTPLAHFLPRFAPRRLRRSLQTGALLATLVVTTTSLAQAPGLRAARETRWPGSSLITLEAQEGRLLAAGPWSIRLGRQDAGSPNPATSPLYWLGDYRFATTWGLRATGGLLGKRDSAGDTSRTPLPQGLESGRNLTAPDGLRATPYLGVGLDHARSAGDGWGGWGLTADLGLVSRSWASTLPFAADSHGLRLGNSAAGEDWLRSLRLMPVVQVGVSYSF